MRSQSLLRDPKIVKMTICPFFAEVPPLREMQVPKLTHGLDRVLFK